MKIKHGFGLLEVMIAIAIIGIAMAVVVPNYQGRQPRFQREQFIASLNGLAQFARQSAIIKNKIHKVVFDFSNRAAWIEHVTGEQKPNKELIFERTKSSSARASITWKEQFTFKNFFIEGFDELARFSGRPTEEIWFFVVPEGLTQEVVINFIDTKDRIERKPRPIGLVLNPFTAQFRVYDSLQKP